MSEPLFIIIDGNSFMHRAFHGMPPFKNKEGFPTQIIAGVSNMINGQLTKLKPAKVVVVFDHKGKTFRHDMFEGYKGDRPSLPDDFRVQIEPLKELIAAWGLPMMSIPYVEADDSMSTLAIQAKEAGYKVAMLTSDKDMCQIVDEDIGILDTKDIEKGNVVRHIEGVKEKMKVYPNQIVPFLALVGDKADCVPGVEGVGEGTAAKWLAEYKTLENLIANKENIKGKVGANFVKAVEDGSFQLSIDLVTIKTDVDLGQTVEEFQAERDDEKLLELVTKYELHGLKKSLGVVDTNAESASSTVVTDENKILAFLEEVKKEDNLFIELIKLDGKDKFLMSSEKVDSIFLVDVTEHLNTLTELATDNKHTIISLKAKSIINKLFNLTKNEKLFFCKLDDIRVYDYVHFTQRSKEATLEHLNNDHSKFNLSELRETYKLNGKTPKWNKMTEEEILEVRSEEVSISKYIFENKIEEINTNISKMDNKILSVLSYMETNGALIQPHILKTIGEELSEILRQKEEIIYKIAGEEFSIASPKQVQAILFDKLGLPAKKKTTAEDALRKAVAALTKNKDLEEEKKEDLTTIVNEILEHRSLSKIIGTYVVGLTERMTKDNKVHTTYQSTVTSTGRFSSIDPNLQNIPIRNEEGRKIRNAFIAKKGYKILAVDYSQIELRILAHLANDEAFIRAFNNGEDIHKQTAADILGIDISEVTDDQRRIAKAINFGLIYGMGEKRLAEDNNITRKEAKVYYNGFFDTYVSVKPYFDEELERAKENLYIKTILGRKLSTKDVNANNSMIRSHAEKAAKNAGIQGSAAEIIKLAMIDVFDFIFNEAKEDAIMIMQVHDELVFEVKEDKAEELAERIKSIMENVIELKVPLVAEYKIADNWNEAH
ncbi:MAG: DNA polymerase I [Chloroflexi bacterium]|nr:DNA polymerase I [Chloroflexota bacterium]|tara:strand:- start:50227 stop:52884 length:2658 start_codon:yes stop_codon:yes gene_type:complete